MELMSIRDTIEFDPSKVIKRVPIMTDQVIAMVFYIGPNKEIPPHSHEDVDELHYVINGRGEIKIDDESEPMHRGKLVLVPRGKRHHFSAGDEGLIMLSVSPVAQHDKNRNQSNLKEKLIK